jgi:hypothetical protein
MAYSLMAGVMVERVGDDLMVIIPGNSDVVSVSGRPAEVLLDVKAGRKVDLADPALRDLVDLGIVSAPGISRRGLIKAGAIVAGAGVAVMAMPGVATASSEVLPAGVWWWELGSGDEWHRNFGFYGGTDPDAANATRGLGTRLEGFFPRVGSPSALTVPVTGSPATVQFNDQSVPFGGVRWTIYLSGFNNAGPLPDALPADIIGTFDWDGPQRFRFSYEFFPGFG